MEKYSVFLIVHWNRLQDYPGKSFFFPESNILLG